MRLLSLSLFCSALVLTACGQEASTNNPTASSAPASAASVEVAATAEPTPAPEPAALAADAGERLYKRTCFVCHDTGAGGAPKRNDHAAWQVRADKGLDALMQSTIHGLGGMPPRGQAPSASDAELEAAVQYILATLPQAGEAGEAAE